MTLTIRDAEQGELAVLRGIFRRSALSNEGDRANMLANPETLEFSLPPFGRGTVRVAVLDDGRIAGFATPLVEPDFVELEDLFVEPDCMRHGVGRALIQDAAEVARQHGLRRVAVTANPHAMAFYERVGFVAEGVVETRFSTAPRMFLNVPTSG